MSSSTSALRTVLRGAAARQVQAVPFDLNLDDAVGSISFDPAAAAEAVADARATGFDAGYRDGYAAGLATAEAEARIVLERQAGVLDQAVAALDVAARQLGARSAVDIARIEDQLADAAFAIAEAVIGRELEVAREPGRDAVARALAIAPEGPATVRLHPDDVSTAGGDFGREVTIVPDPTVEPGGSVVEIGSCRIDAQISTALERVREALR